MRHHLLFIPIVLILSGCLTTSPLENTGTEPSLGHPASGLVFPDKVPGWIRENIRTYDENGENIGIGYNHLNLDNPVTLTLYIYPGARLTSKDAPPEAIQAARTQIAAEHLASVKSGMLHYRPLASMISEGPISLELNGSLLTGRAISLRSEEQFAGRSQTVVTTAEVYSYDDWFIKFRSTYLLEQQEHATEAIQHFRAAFIKMNN